DPETFKIIDGKLFLFYNAYFNNTLKSWNKDEINLKKQADKNWSKFYTMP
nr:YHS domain protein [Bacteroidia bacterium]